MYGFTFWMFQVQSNIVELLQFELFFEGFIALIFSRNVKFIQCVLNSSINWKHLTPNYVITDEMCMETKKQNKKNCIKMT